jgi:hypothetical protein
LEEAHMTVGTLSDSWRSRNPREPNGEHFLYLRCLTITLAP